MDLVWGSAHSSCLDRGTSFTETTWSSENNTVHSTHSNAQCALSTRVLSSSFHLNLACGKGFASFALVNSEDIAHFHVSEILCHKWWQNPLLERLWHLNLGSRVLKIGSLYGNTDSETYWSAKVTSVTGKYGASSSWFTAGGSIGTGDTQKCLIPNNRGTCVSAAWVLAVWLRAAHQCFTALLAVDFSWGKLPTWQQIWHCCHRKTKSNPIKQINLTAGVLLSVWFLFNSHITSSISATI